MREFKAGQVWQMGARHGGGKTKIKAVFPNFISWEHLASEGRGPILGQWSHIGFDEWVTKFQCVLVEDDG
jgi:hypothetical protein